MTTDSVDRAVGALLGLATGDAVGTTLEFEPPGSFEPITDLVGGGPFHLAAGQWTDDTSMALCLAESLLDTGTMDLADQMRRYLLWQKTGYLSSNGRCFDIGGTTRHQLARFGRTGEPIDPHTDDDAAANGSLMRLAPVPIRWHADPEAAAEQAATSSRPTHAAARPVDACRLLGAMTAALIAGTPPEEVLAPGFWRWGDLHPEVAALAAGSWRDKEPPVVRGTGYCVDALEAALWAVAGGADFREAVLRAANLGDDADTTAAIAGQLAGAAWGATGIPEAWRAQGTLVSRITQLATGRFAAGGGEVPPGRWPHDDVVHAWWVEPGRLLAGEYPGHSEGTIAAEKVNLLVDAGVRTFVDLTEVHERLEPYAEHVEAAAVARRLDLRHHRCPIPDFHVIDDDGYDAILDLVHEEQARGAVYVHCWGGRGRTGTVVGCFLARQGLDYEAVIARMAQLREGSSKAGHPVPEADAQHEVLRRRAMR
jgi:ADP-ribosylglycohydrolase/protein-tyrosine phosphatase